MAFRMNLSKANKAQLGSKAKAEEEAKAREEKNALAKVMAEFEQEHGEEGGVLRESERDHEPERDMFVPTGTKRHFTGRPRSMKSGPGTLDSVPGMGFAGPGGPGGFGNAPQSRFGGPVPRGPAAQEGTRAEENVYTTVVAQASNLPPGIDPRRIEDLFSEFPSLKVVKVERLPPSSPSHKGRPSTSMKVIFDKSANPRELDEAMMRLNDKRYLGKGYYLHLDRYLGGRSMSTKRQDEAFGATLQDVEVAKGVAPPSEFGGMNKDRNHNRMRDEVSAKRLMVTVNTPPDPATLRLIHQVIEGVIQGGVEFEAALMNDQQVQEEERFAWLFNQRHPLNRYYRWRLHEIVCGTNRPDIFDREAEWKPPKEPLIDEYASGVWDIKTVSDNSDSEEEEEKPQRVTLPIGDNYPGRVDTGYGMLSPRSRTFLIWLLVTLPPSSVYADEVAAISAFAVEHATKGLDEVVHLLISNIIQPFHFTPANPKNRPDAQDGEENNRKRIVLTTNALRVISDVALSTWKESGACYKYRIAIGSQLVEREIFEYLDTLPIKLDMGRMGETSFREEVNTILKIWQDEHLFEKTILDHLDDAFNARKREEEQEALERKTAERRKHRKAAAQRKATDMGSGQDEDRMDIDDEGPAINSMDGANDEVVDPPPTDVNASMEPTTQEQSAAFSEPQDEPPRDDGAKRQPVPDEIPGETAAARARRLRPKAEDMFASDEE